jgi:ubiquinone/menaquinone biosynthesis C-methylase UbiE
MAGLYSKQANEYSESTPTYPASWFSMLASLTPGHQLAWDVGAGNGQASLSIAEHYDRVIATDVSKEQLELAQNHSKVTYALTPPVMTDEELSSIVGEEGSVDLVTVATAVHWFDLETFYSQVKRVLRKPGGVIAVWTYFTPSISPAVDAVCKDLRESIMPYCDPRVQYAVKGYKTLPFPFEPVLENGRGREGNPIEMEMDIQLSLDKFLGFYKSSHLVAAAKEKGVELLNEKVWRRLKDAWGDENTIYTCKLPVYMLAGTSSL